VAHLGARANAGTALFEEKVVREISCRGGVTLQGDDADEDQIHVEGVIVNFVPVPGIVRCLCGAELSSWNLRQNTGGAELVCTRCHRTQGRLEAGVRTHRG
jgi:hypothetical protein